MEIILRYYINLRYDTNMPWAILYQSLKYSLHEKQLKPYFKLNPRRKIIFND